MQLITLPSELLTNIFFYLSFDELCILQLVCHYFNNFIRSREFALSFCRTKKIDPSSHFYLFVSRGCTIEYYRKFIYHRFLNWNDDNYCYDQREGRSDSYWIAYYDNNKNAYEVSTRNDNCYTNEINPSVDAYITRHCTIDNCYKFIINRYHSPREDHSNSYWIEYYNNIKNTTEDNTIDDKIREDNILDHDIINFFSSINKNVLHQEHKKKLIDVEVEYEPEYMDYDDEDYRHRGHHMTIQSPKYRPWMQWISWISWTPWTDYTDSSFYEIKTLKLSELSNNNLSIISNLILDTTIQHLKIDYRWSSSFNGKTIFSLGNLIRKNLTVQELSLENFRLDDEMTMHIGESINSNSSIHCLNLNVTDYWTKHSNSSVHLLDILKQNKNIKTLRLNLSNNTYIQPLINFLVDNQTLENLDINFSYCEPETDKLFTVLSNNRKFIYHHFLNWNNDNYYYDQREGRSDSYWIAYYDNNKNAV